MLLRAMFNHPLHAAREMDRLFDSMISSQPIGSVPVHGQASHPAINVWEDEGSHYAEAELPGLAMDDIEVFVSGDELTIRGERRVDAPENARPLRRERAVGAFERTIVLPTSIDVEHVEASLNDGVLSVKLPKSAAVRPRKVAVKSLPSG